MVKMNITNKIKRMLKINSIFNVNNILSPVKQKKKQNVNKNIFNFNNVVLKQKHFNIKNNWNFNSDKSQRVLRQGFFTPIKRQKFTNEELIQILRQLAQELGRTPKIEDLKQRSDLPCFDVYYNYFGSWNNALIMAGLIPTKRMDYTKEELIKILQQLAQELGRTPKVEDLKQHSDLPSFVTYINYFNSWNNALIAAGLTPTERHNYTKEKLIQLLQQLAQELGRTPKVEDLKQHSKLPAGSTFNYYFGTWNNALRAAGLVPTRRKDYTKEELIKILQQLSEKLGRTPTGYDLHQQKDLPSVKTYQNHFGSWTNALKEAGLE